MQLYGLPPFLCWARFELNVEERNNGAFRDKKLRENVTSAPEGNRAHSRSEHPANSIANYWRFPRCHKMNHESIQNGAPGIRCHVQVESPAPEPWLPRCSVDRKPSQGHDRNPLESDSTVKPLKIQLFF